MKKAEIIELVQYRNFLLHRLEETIKEQQLAEQDNLLTVGTEARIKQMDDLEEKILEIEKTFKEKGMFHAEGFTSFMTQFLTLTEGNFVRTILRPEYNVDTLGNPTCYVISSKEMREVLKETVKTDQDVVKFLYSKVPEDVTKIVGEVVYPFRRNLRMKHKYAKHPRLKTAIYELMQLRMDNPELSEEECYKIVLENTVRRNLNRSANNSK